MNQAYLNLNFVWQPLPLRDLRKRPSIQQVKYNLRQVKRSMVGLRNHGLVPICSGKKKWFMGRSQNRAVKTS